MLNFSPIPGMILHMPLPTDNNQLINFFKKYPLIKFEKGERVVRPKQLENNVMLIKSGLVRVFSLSNKGENTALTCLNSTAYGGLVLGLYHGIFNHYYVQALSPVEAWDAPKSNFFKFLDKNPQASMEVMMNQSLLISDLYCQIQWLKTGTAYNKVAALLYSMGTHLSIEVKGKKQVGVKTTHQDLADLSGLTRETITAQVNKLRKKKIIEYKNSVITIPSLDQLKAEAGSIYN